MLLSSIKSSSLKIVRGFLAIRKELINASKSSESIKTSLNYQSKLKKESIFRNNLSYRKRSENAKRREIEAELEASNIANIISSRSKRQKFASYSGGGFLERITNTIGYITAGWLINNLPSWIEAGNIFVRRIQNLNELGSNFTKSLIGFVYSIGNVGQSFLGNILKLDFLDSERKLRTSFGEMTKNFNQLESSLDRIFDQLMKPFTEEEKSQKPPKDQLYPETSPTPTTTTNPSNQTRASYGTPEQRAMLDAIAWAEGGVTYRTMFGGGQFDISKGWKHPDTVVHGKRYSSAAAGRYQFLPRTWNMAARALGLKDFSPINQDKAAIYLMDRRLGGNSADILRREGVSNRVLNAFAGEWAAVPNAYGRSAYGQPVKKIKAFKDKYNSFLNTTSQQQQPPQQQPQQPPRTQPTPQTRPSTSFIPVSGDSGPGMGKRPLSVPYSMFKSGSGAVITSGMGYRWGRPHTGYDLAAPAGTPMYAYFPGKVTHVNKTDRYGKGYGYWIVWKDSIYGAYHFFGHMQGPSPLNPGDKIDQGTFMGRVGSTGRSTGPHVHWEISNNPPSSNGNFSSLENPGEWLKVHPFKRQSSTSEPAQIAPQSILRGLPRSDKPRQQIVIVDEDPPQVPSSPSITVPFSPPIAQIDDGTVLNRFIKQKLLLDLTYL